MYLHSGFYWLPLTQGSEFVYNVYQMIFGQAKIDTQSDMSVAYSAGSFSSLSAFICSKRAMLDSLFLLLHIWSLILTWGRLTNKFLLTHIEIMGPTQPFLISFLQRYQNLLGNSCYSCIERSYCTTQKYNQQEDVFKLIIPMAVAAPAQWWIIY